MSDSRRGLAFGAGAYILWGLFPLYWPLLKPAGPLEILAHRFVWSLVVVLIILAIQRRWRWIPALLRRPRRVAMLVLAAVFIAANWWTYIYGVNTGRVVETSLGYFINPLVTVMMGVVLLRERLRRVQWLALGLGAIAVLVLAIDYGRLPWIALVLAFSFASYGLIKKVLSMDAVQSLTAETAVLFLPALGVLLLMGGGTFTLHGPAQDTLLATSGVVTAIPLLLFGASARRLPLSTLGLLQYFGPALQFIIGVGVYHEPMPLSRLLGFALVWAALVMLTVDGLRNGRRRSRTPEALEPVAG
ncbi:MAG: EamA family transporter RarD [Mycobacteriales bacterium]